jgi:hypothetical protein
MLKSLAGWTWAFALGAIVGVLLLTWLAPFFIAWYFEPPVEFGVSCTDPIRWALRRFQKAQFAGLLIGGFGALLVRAALRGGRDPHGSPS